MNKSLKITISAIFLALILFLSIIPASASMALTETIYTLPNGGVELTFHEKVYQTNWDYRVEYISIGLGILSNFSIWLDFQYLHKGAFESGKNYLGDMSLKAWFFIGDYCNDMIHIGFLVKIGFPTGKNAYYTSEYRNLALGNSEIKLGPVIQFDIIERMFVHLNLFYTFRQGKNEDFWGGFYINPGKKETYINILGLNPFSKGAFFYYERLKNDYVTFSFAFNTNVIYPVIPYIELYTSFRLYRREIETDDIMIEGAGIDPLLLSIGFRFFILETIYLGIYGVFNPLWQDDYIKYICGIEFSAQF